jgi:hypothetical protein
MDDLRRDPDRIPGSAGGTRDMVEHRTPAAFHLYGVEHYPEQQLAHHFTLYGVENGPIHSFELYGVEEDPQGHFHMYGRDE